MAKMFIIHSENDKELVNEFYDLLVDGIGMPAKEIFYSSIKKQGVKAGGIIDKIIKDNLKNATFFVAIITPNYYTSMYAQFETGAAWASSKTLIPIVVPPLDCNNLKDPLKAKSSLQINISDHLDIFKKQIINSFKLKMPKNDEWNTQKKIFLNYMSSTNMKYYDLFINNPSYSVKFSDYCTMCINMLDDTNGEILTVQTPHTVDGSEEPFKGYLDVTVEKLLEREKDGTPLIHIYKRLVIVGDCKYKFKKEKNKIRIFLEKLINKAKERTPFPELGNIKVCIVHVSHVRKLFYSNIDLHICSLHNFALAFHELDHEKLPVWATSIHFNEGNSNKCHETIDKLKGAFNIIWKQGASDGGLFDFKEKELHNKIKTNGSKFIEDVEDKIDEIGKKFRQHTIKKVKK